MKMNKKLDKYLKSKSAAYWHYYHLKRDPDFKKEASILAEQIIIHTSDIPPFLPMCIEDYDLAQDSEKEHKLELIKAFQERWGIKSSYALLNYLLQGDENHLSVTNFNYALSFDEDTNMFTIQIPDNVQKEDVDRLWESIQEWKKHIRVVKKRPREDTIRESNIVYDMWKLRRDYGIQGIDKSWTKVSKEIDKKYNTQYEANIRDAEDFYKSHSYLNQVG